MRGELRIKPVIDIKIFALVPGRPAALFFVVDFFTNYNTKTLYYSIQFFFFFRLHIFNFIQK
jgi:hypothetical protein